MSTIKSDDYRSSTGGTPRIEHDGEDLIAEVEALQAALADEVAVLKNSAFVQSGFITGFIYRGEWTTATDYNTDELVLQAGKIYRVVNDHTSTVFVTDFGNGDLREYRSLTEMTDLYAEASNVANAYSIELARAPDSYTKGQVYWWKVSATNTGAATLNVNSLGAKAIVNHAGNALIAGDLAVNELIQVIYDSVGDHFKLLKQVFASSAEVNAGTSNTKIVSPAGLNQRVASEILTGLIELATQDEIDTNDVGAADMAVTVEKLHALTATIPGLTAGAVTSTPGAFIAAEIITATGAFTATKPATASKAFVRLVGSGANGASSGGPGGGGGGTLEAFFSGIITDITGSVGGGNTTCSMNTGTKTGTANAGSGASGGSASAVGDDWSIVMPGQNGADAISTAGAAGGDSHRGFGGYKTSAGTATAGQIYGGGGAGADSGSGGAGAQGIAEIYWYE